MRYNIDSIDNLLSKMDQVAVFHQILTAKILLSAHSMNFSLMMKIITREVNQVKEKEIEVSREETIESCFKINS
jgi:chemotaxis receptor (MCP) glutamine deamidase CheD